MWPWPPQPPLTAIRDIGSGSGGSTVWIGTSRTWLVFQGPARLGMGFAAGLLLLVCSLMAGLILAVCGLDETLLKMKSVSSTGNARKQALSVLRLKKHYTWMLCSLIIISVACGEALPFVVQTVFDVKQIWIPILVSTLSIAIFAEILPQYLIPRDSLWWSYYCRTIIWSCMWFTAIISLPLSWILETIWHRKQPCGIFNVRELAALVKYHEKSAKNGGMLGPAASGAVIGALRLESRSIGPEILDILPVTDTEKDIEKADIVTAHGLIVRWPAVKTISIDEPVNEAFIAKIKNWNYSRIPVIGNPPKNEAGTEALGPRPWNGSQVYGFLHTKNLITIDVKAQNASENILLVKDLPLYPIPIVREDMPVYDLLNIFQLGISRIAIVVPTPSRETSFCAVQFTTNHSLHGFTNFNTMLWTATQRTNARILSELNRGGATDEKDELNRDCLECIPTDSLLEGAKNRGCRVVGVRTPKPIGIVTFEDIIDTLLQKTSKDERDFYDRGTNPPTKSKKPGDAPCSPFGFPYIEMQTDAQNKREKHNSRSPSRKTNRGTLRQRKVSSKVHALDGVDERSIDDCLFIQGRKQREYQQSSYTVSSIGGFHNITPSFESESSSSTRTGLGALSPEDVAELGNTSPSLWTGNPYSEAESASLHQGGFNTEVPRLPVVRRMSSLEGLVYEIEGREMIERPDGEERYRAGGGGTSLNMRAVRGALSGEKSMMSVSEDGEAGDCEVENIGGGMEGRKPYAGFPVSLLENPKREHHWGREIASRTMPRLMSSLDLEPGVENGEEVGENEGGGDVLEIGARRTSYWF